MFDIFPVSDEHDGTGWSTNIETEHKTCRPAKSVMFSGNINLRWSVADDIWRWGSNVQHSSAKMNCNIIAVENSNVATLRTNTYGNVTIYYHFVPQHSERIYIVAYFVFSTKSFLHYVNKEFPNRCFSSLYFIICLSSASFHFSFLTKI